MRFNIPIGLSHLFKHLKDIEHHINFKFDQFGCKSFQNKTTKKHHDIHQNALQIIKSGPINTSSQG
jgi:hypothetical protein